MISDFNTAAETGLQTAISKSSRVQTIILAYTGEVHTVATSAMIIE